jgi:hypothetical protein
VRDEVEAGRSSPVEQPQLGEGGVAIEARAYFAQTGRLSSGDAHCLQARRSLLDSLFGMVI